MESGRHSGSYSVACFLQFFVLLGICQSQVTEIEGEGHSVAESLLHDWNPTNSTGSIDGRMIVPRVRSNEIRAVLNADGSRHVVGTGSSGNVFLSQLQQDATLCVVKILGPHVGKHDFQREVHIVWYLNSSLVTPRFYGLLRHNEQDQKGYVMAFVGDRVTGESLSVGDVISDSWSVLSDVAVLELALALTLALQRLHTMDVFHGDLRPENILLEDQEGWRVVFVDLGQSWLASDSYHYQISPSTQYRFLLTQPGVAPELLRGGYFSLAADMYSLGYLLKLLAGKHDLPTLGLLAAQCYRTVQERRLTVHQLTARVEHLLQFARWLRYL